MPRAVRIEFENAIYHVMARGNRREDIAHDDGDRKLFLTTLEEVCGQTGWRVFAWVLMSNHYHLVFQTPSPNLVSGMTWFQNTFTRRINAKNRLWGRLFGDRYKAVLVENDPVVPQSRYRPADYLVALINYVHLNPARAGLVNPATRPGESLLDYPWSSLAGGYGRAPSKRPKWLEVTGGLARVGHPDTDTGRRLYVTELDDRARSEAADKLGLVTIEGQTLHSTLRRGWYWGSQEFREALLERFGGQLRERNDVDRTVRSSSQGGDFSKKRAEQIIRSGNWELNLTEHEIRHPRRGDQRRVAIAWAVWTRTSGVSLKWIAERLNLKSAANASQRIRQFDAIPPGNQPEEIRKWITELL